MRGLAELALFFGGCTWGWSSFQLADGSFDGGSFDGGRFDGGDPPDSARDAGIDAALACEAPYVELCPAKELCVRQAADRPAPCCAGCLDLTDRPVGWAERFFVANGTFDGVPMEDYCGP